MNTASMFLKASTDACASEIGAIETNLKAIDGGATMELIEWISPNDFCQRIQGKKFGIIYLGAHADGTGFGENAPGAWHTWDDLASSICATDCIAPKGILFMGCCRGGMRTIALKIFKTCNKIDYIVGPNQATRAGDLVTAFTAFVRNLKKGANPVSATTRASGATGDDYTCHDRQELEVDVNLSQQLDEISYNQQILLLQQSQILEKLTILVPDQVRQTAAP